MNERESACGIPCASSTGSINASPSLTGTSAAWRLVASRTHLKVKWGQAVGVTSSGRGDPILSPLIPEAIIAIESTT